MRSVTWALAGACWFGVGLVAAHAEQQAPSPDRENKTEFTAAFNLKQGTSDVTLLSLGLRTAAKQAHSEVFGEGQFAYGKENENKNVDDAFLKAQFNRFLSKRWYLNMKADAGYDAIALVDYRYILGLPGPGYYLLNSKETRLAVEIGPSYLWEEVDGLTDDYPSLRLSQRWNQQLGVSSRMWQLVDFFPELEESTRYLLNVEFGLSAAVNSHLNLTFTIRNRYNSNPAETTAKREINMLTGLSYAL